MIKKVCLINTYSDFNKGDLGIVLGTVTALKSSADDIEINCVSSFVKEDPFFETHHEYLKKHVNKIYSTVIGRLFSESNSTLELTYKLFVDFYKMFFIYFMPLWMVKIFALNSENNITLELLDNSDVIISKGGSFICNRNTLKDKIRLLRELTIIVLSLRLKKDVYILGQSIGPVYGTISRIIVEKIFSKTKKVVLRETECLKEYKKIRVYNNVVGNDFAFNLSKDITPSEKINSGVVGLTIKRFNDHRQDKLYTNILVDIIEYIVKSGKRVHIVPHVTIDDDLKKSREVVSQLDEKIKKQVKLDTSEYDIWDLHDLYSTFDVLIGTRLHSTIFAMNVNTKVINISYHGTKSIGVFKRFGIEEYVISGNNFNIKYLKDKYDKIQKAPINYRKLAHQAAEENINICRSILNA